MVRILSWILLVSACVPALAQDSVDALAARAARSYQHAEWSSAAAMYLLVSDKKPKAPLPYTYIMVSEGMRGDSAAVVAALERALVADVPLDSVLSPLLRETMTLGRPELYEKELKWSAESLPWMRRRIDVKLLDYYTSRRNAHEMAAYAEKILAGVPDNVPTLVLLGRSYAMQGHFDQAVATWEKAAQLQPDNYDLLLELGNYYAIEDSARALPYLRKACAIRPTPYLEQLIKKLSPKP